MEQSQVTISRIDWNEVFPVSILLRTLPVAGSGTIWLLALAGVLVSPIGWWFFQAVFLGSLAQQENPVVAASAAMHASPSGGVFDSQPGMGIGSSAEWSWARGPIAVFEKIGDPYYQLFRWQGSWRANAYWICGAIWTLAVWSLIGCAIARAALVRLAREESLGVDEAIEFSFQKAQAVGLAILAPLAFIVLLAIPGLIAGWIMHLDFGLAIVGALWIVVILFAIVMTFLVAGLFLGWPMVAASIAADRIAPLDGLTRVYSYIIQKPVNYAVYVVLAVIFGSICWWAVAALAQGTISLAHWSTSWGLRQPYEQRVAAAEFERVARQANADVPAPQASTLLKFGHGAVRFWNGFVATLAVAFLYGHFWVMASAVFLLLRRDVDQVELDEVYLPEDERAMELPPVIADKDGIPTIQPLEPPSPAPPRSDEESE